MNLDRRLLLLLREHPLPFVTAVVFGAAGGLLLIVQASVLATVVDALFLEKSGVTDIAVLLLFYGLASLLRAAFSHTERSAADRGTLRIKQTLHERLLHKTAALGPLQTRSVQSGKLGATILRGVESLDAYFSQYLPQLALSLFVPLCILGAVFSADLPSGFILLGTAPLIPLFMTLIGKAAKKATARQWNTLSRMSGSFLDVLQGLTTLILFGRSRERIHSIGEISERFRHATMSVLKTAFLSSLALELVGTIGTAIIAVEIGLRLMAGAIAFKPALFILLLTPDFYLPLRTLGAKFHAGMEGTSAAGEIFALLDRPEPSTKGNNTRRAEPVRHSGPIVFDGVSYTYPGGRDAALKEVRCTLEAGRCTAIAGPSGGGKTTFGNLLLKFATPSNGIITCGGKPLEEMDRDEWLQGISWVPQQPYIFHATLRENLLLAKPDATEAELMQALRSSRLENLVHSLPLGLDTPAGERGARISGGEAQRLSLARAFLKNAPVILLDEPVSHTDPALEVELLASMQSLIEGKTSIIIAHRLSTIEHADNILVFDRGRIVQSGSHAELVSKEGFYRNALLSIREESAA